MVGSGARRFKKLVSKFPGGWETALGYGMQFFMNQQDPEEVNFVRFENGWALEVKVEDEEKVDDAEVFWEENIRPKL